MDAQASVIVELLAQILDEYGPEIFKDEEELCQVIEEVFSDAELEEAKELLLVVAESGALRYVGDFQLPDLEIPDSYEVGRHKALLVLMQKEEMPEELAEFVLEMVDEALGLGTEADVDFLEELEEAAEDGEEEGYSPVAALLDENNNANIFLFNEQNEKMEFEQIALVPIDGKLYAILRPVVPVEGVADDEALVFVIEEIEGEDCLVIEEDDEVIDAVFEEYYKMLREAGVDVD